MADPHGTVGAALRGRPFREEWRRGGHGGPPLQLQVTRLSDLALLDGNAASRYLDAPSFVIIDNRDGRNSWTS